MSTYQTVKTQYVAIDGNRVAYRRLGTKSTFPLLYINHLRGSMDTIDPLLMNSIARNREVIVYDSFGIGHSEGTVPPSTDTMASIAAKLLSALGISKADVIGFSMGGGVAQMLAWDYPQLVNKLVLAGTQPGVGEGVVLPPREVLEGAGAINDEPPTREEMFHLFFYPSESSLALGDAWWKRIHERKVDGEERKGHLVGAGAQAQLNAIFSFTVDTNNFERLKDIKAPTLVTNGHTDIMSPTSNSFTLQQNLRDAQLIIYPDAGHGHLFQVPELYAKHLELFLSDTR
ncbi:Alpha beta fold family [Colletotrichum higginsianum IMI 349063]|uniref:Alpha beta fold family n=2 Tax=Colletotrichum higginsianum TaxID=80884 RepID=A0A1B7YCY8_COLHI|nr:Alpha beta fold family [Colletotrichum higginsianum IMI 349063]OBR09718.1 Alpha beta fold family [Colletotrichum higginsianum IMI 349063]TID07092.1 putative aminoacrylate hydrolase RutD [Colletotrichum higginsianum]GJD03266.1 alpha beta fold family [Colletotrichum higginsianum]